MYKSKTFAPYGPEHVKILTALAGERPSAKQIVDTCVYLTPNYRTVKTSDGRYIQMVEQTHGDMLYEFANSADYHEWREKWVSDFPIQYLR